MAKIDTSSNYLNANQVRELAKVTQDVYYFSLFIFVIHPMRGKVRFDLYPYQKSVLYQFLKKRFNIILKFRQAGITELISMYCLWLAMYHPNKKINIISIKDTTAKKVLKKIKYMYKNLPPHLQTPIINGRTGEYGSASLIEFSNGSFIESIPTSEEAGRSESLSLLVIDEAAIVRWASTIWASAFPTLSTGGSAIINSCVTGDTKLICKSGDITIKDICPPEFGKKDISNLGLQVLTHTGKWQRIVGSVNKGLLKTWEIHNDFGDIIKCTPHHKLYTQEGWLPVKEIIDKDIPVIFYDTGLNELDNNPITTPPPIEIFKRVKGFPNYEVSNLGRVFICKGGKRIEKKPKASGLNGCGEYRSISLWHNNIRKKISVHNLVAKTFIGDIKKGYIVDHINNNPSCNYVTNLQIIPLAYNTKRAARFSRGMKLASRIKSGFKYDLKILAYIRNRYKELGFYYGVFNQIHNEILDKFDTDISTHYIQGIASGKKSRNIYLSSIRLVKEYMDYIYDICVEEDQSYITDTNYISHNTPYGVGNFYHSTWVDAVAGGESRINPIRLFWQMHPERDQGWYDEMASVLGSKRTAQEIDGDFLSSGNSVFDLVDIKAIEDTLPEYQPIRTRFNGQYREFEEPDPKKEYFIGADCATGRATDYSAFSCVDKAGEDAAVFKGRIPLNKYGKLLGDIGKKFNYAKLAPETNDVGMATTLYLQDEGYPNLYYSTKLLKKKGKNRPETEDIPGWLTTTKNRSLIIENLEKDIREDNIIVKDPFFVQEAYTFIYDGVGRPVAMGKHNNKSSVDIDLEGETYSDDAIFGKSIANHIRKGVTRNTVVLPQ